MTLDEGGVDGVGQTKFGNVASDVVFLLVSSETV